jgi:hypothetical protein
VLPLATFQPSLARVLLFGSLLCACGSPIEPDSSATFPSQETAGAGTASGASGTNANPTDSRPGRSDAASGTSGSTSMPAAGSVGLGGAAGSSATPQAGITGAAGAAQSIGGSAGTAVGPDAGTAGSSSCASDRQLNPHPFGCAFAWGANGNEGGRDSYLDFITTWVGYEWTQNREQDCDGCRLAAELASKAAVAVYYAYFIGSVLPDCNVEPNGSNLCTDGARYIRDNRARILEVYGRYAQQTHQASPNKPVVWLLEGDFMQYTETTQSAALSLSELGALARDITCAIRNGQPDAVVAINHTTWNSDQETDDFWRAMPLAEIDFVWTTGVGDNAGFISRDTNATSYNAKSATYRYVHELTAKPIWVDTSFGLSQQSDSWTGVAASELNRRLDDGVFAVNVTMPPSDYAARVQALRGALDPVCP